MSPGLLVRVLGLCNVVAGALLACAPTFVAPLEGIHSPAATLATRSTAALLLAIAIGAWSMPPAAVRRYLWIFGVGVKGAGVIIWAAAALATGVPHVWLGAVLDLAVAALIVLGLTTRPS